MSVGYSEFITVHHFPYGVGRDNQLHTMNQLSTHNVMMYNKFPLKFQEPNTQDESGSGEIRDGETNGGDKRGVSSSLSSLIKVSPLKSLLREDLRRRISARGRARNSNVRIVSFYCQKKYFLWAV